MTSLGEQTRLNRIFSNPSGRMLGIAADHLITCPVGMPDGLPAIKRTVERIVELADARSLSVPLAWYPRLQHGTPEERNNWRLIGCGDGIHWPDLDEDIGISGLVAGCPSGESPSSLERWLKARG